MGGININPKKINRIGTMKINKYGSKMIVDIYENALDVWVTFIEFEDRVHTTWLKFQSGNVKSVFDKSVHNNGYLGKGKYVPTINGKYTPQYSIWSAMIGRCYNKNYYEKHPTYKGCSVHEEWLNFQNFGKWYDENYYEVEDEMMCLDKDILLKGNKVYSSETCVFVPKSINSLFVKRNADRGSFPIGVSYLEDINVYTAKCGNGKGKTINIGSYNTPMEAFSAYKKYKENMIKQLAYKYKDKIPVKLYEAMINYIVEITD